MTLKIVPATEGLLTSLAGRLRVADRAEAAAAGVTDVATSFRLTLASPDPTMLAVDREGLPWMAWGAWPDPTFPEMGWVWLMAAEGIEAFRRPIIAQSRPLVDGYHERYAVLTNLVDARNTTHIRWLRWCGFVFLREVSVNGHTFFEFARIRPCALPSSPPHRSS